MASLTSSSRNYRHPTHNLKRTLTMMDDLASQPYEPLAVTAPLARTWSQTLCHRNDDPADSCAWLHGFWQYLRLLAIADTSHPLFVTTPRHHAAFYWEALRPLIRLGMRRVLVSGCADYSMPAHVLWVYAAEQVEADMTVVDLCETPLRLCSWYGERVKARFTVEVADILSYQSCAPFDIICTHSFFGHFSPSKRMKLLEHWRSLLTPSGRVITVNRIRPNGIKLSRFIGMAHQNAHDLASRLAKDAGERLHIDPEEFAAMAATYIAARSRRYSIGDVEEFRTLFEGCGFRIESLHVDPLTTHTSSDLNANRNAQYAKVVAIRNYSS